MEYLSIGKLKILKNYSKTDGVFVDSSNKEQEGSRYRFLLDGIAKYSLVVEYIKFSDGTGAGPKRIVWNGILPIRTTAYRNL